MMIIYVCKYEEQVPGQQAIRTIGIFRSNFFFLPLVAIFFLILWQYRKLSLFEANEIVTIYERLKPLHDPQYFQ